MGWVGVCNPQPEQAIYANKEKMSNPYITMIASEWADPIADLSASWQKRMVANPHISHMTPQDRGTCCAIILLFVVMLESYTVRADFDIESEEGIDIRNQVSENSMPVAGGRRVTITPKKMWLTCLLCETPLRTIIFTVTTIRILLSQSNTRTWMGVIINSDLAHEKVDSHALGFHVYQAKLALMKLSVSPGFRKARYGSYAKNFQV